MRRPDALFVSTVTLDFPRNAKPGVPETAPEKKEQPDWPDPFQEPTPATPEPTTVPETVPTTPVTVPSIPARRSLHAGATS